MSSISLSAYTLQVLRRANQEPMPLDSFNGHDDILNICNLYMNQAQNSYQHVPDRQRLFTIERLQTHDGKRNISGIVKTGDYGYEADLVDSDTGDETHHRLTTEAELLPFYFLLWLPANSKKGIVILQRFKQFGINSLFYLAITKRFNENFRNHKLELNPLIPKTFLNQLIDGWRIASATFVKTNAPRDIADIYRTGSPPEEECQVEIVLKAKRRQSIRLKERLKEFVRGDRDLHDLVSLRTLQYDTAKIEFETRGKSRTVNLGDMSKPCLSG